MNSLEEINKLNLIEQKKSFFIFKSNSKESNNSYLLFKEINYIKSISLISF